MFFTKAKKEGAVSADAEKIETLLTRSVAEIIPSKESLHKLLTSKKRLRVKLGIDPTSPHLHIGRAVTILKLKDFQDLGHHIVFIIGDATGVVGDTSDKESERPMLSKEAIETNLREYVGQITKLLDPKQMEVRHNSEWLLKLDYAEIGDQADAFSVADFIARDNIRRRLDQGKRVSLREVLYPLMQGYDSVAVEADVELGGTDQRFNLLAGRALQEKAGQAPQHIVMTELIPGTDGRKMSSSWGNTVNLDAEPVDMFGKLMSIPDSLTETYFVHCTRVPMGEVANVMKQHPKDAKFALAREIVRMYHGEAAAEKAAHDFTETFSKGGVPSDVPAVALTPGDEVAPAVVAAGIVPSKGEWRRLVMDGAVKDAETGEKIMDPAFRFESPRVLRVGKHRFISLKEK